jgi:gliding motility-associated-like protein
MTDTLTVSLESYVAGLNYQWLNTDEVIHLGNGVFQLIWYAPGNFNLQLKMGLDDCEFFSENMAIYVELPLAEPQVNCYETSNDSITVNWTSIQCATDYEVWLDGSLVDLIQDTIYTFQDLEDGQNYEISIVAISDCLCPSAIGTINCITEDCPENVELSIDQLPLAFCVEEFTENLTLTGAVTGSTGGDISWISTITDGDGMIDANTIQPGVYPVSFRYQINSCIYEQIDTFTLYPGVEYDLEVYDISCYYNNDGEIIINPITGSTPFEFYLDGTLQDALETGDLTDGNYLLKVVDANACSFEETISIIRPDEPQIEIGGITLVERGNQYEYEITISQVTYDSIVWYLPVLDSVLCQGSCDQISFAPTDDVELCIEIFYDDDCSMDTCVQIRVNRDVNVFFPNVFSPGNKDGINDYFIPVVSSYESLKVITFDIYDRWGGLMFHKANEVINSQTGEQFGWDGTFDGQEAMSGVYVYYLQLEDSEGEIMHYYGDLTLLR